jgi:3-hydroxybutyryl-CoA dehydrogenase
MMNIQILDTKNSKSFPEGAPFSVSASSDTKILMIIGDNILPAFQQLSNLQQFDLVLLELDLECLGYYTGEEMGLEGSHVLGFARFRMGDDPPTPLIELVKQPNSSNHALNLAKALLEEQQFTVAICADTPGRIVNRLIRPYLNSVLRRLDEGLASASDMDLTLKLGLGYPEGPLSLLSRSGLAHHAQVSQSLFEALGKAEFAPARRALIALEKKRL